MKQFDFELELGQPFSGVDVDDASSSHSKSVQIVIPGSVESSAEENLAAYGLEVAQRFAKIHKKTLEENKAVLLDLATGGSPAPVYKALESGLKQGSVSLANVLATGHEEAWGSYEPRSKSDFDYFRTNLLEGLGLKINPMATLAEFSAENLGGNFIPMHLDDDPSQAMTAFGEIFRSLQKREDIFSVGLYGIGTDGHLGEMQTHDMGQLVSLNERDPFVGLMKHYSVEDGSFYWSDDQGGYQSEDNIFWARGVIDGESYGRAAADGYTGIDCIGSLGWKQLIRMDVLFLTFNSGAKTLSFNLAIEGTMDGVIRAQDSSIVERVKRQKGEGESAQLLADLRRYVEEIGAVVPEARLGRPKAGLYFRALYNKLHEDQANAEDPRYRPIWDFANRYLGKRSPIGRVLRMRTLFGKETVIVATPETVKNSNYKHFLD